MKRAKLLAHDYTSGCLATAYPVEKCFSVTTVSRFEVIDEKYIDESEDENTKNSTGGERTFSKSGRMKETYKEI